LGDGNHTPNHLQAVPRCYIDVIVGDHFGSTTNHPAKQDRKKPLVLTILEAGKEWKVPICVCVNIEI